MLDLFNIICYNYIVNKKRNKKSILKILKKMLDNNSYL